MLTQHDLFDHYKKKNEIIKYIPKHLFSLLLDNKAKAIQQNFKKRFKMSAILFNPQLNSSKNRVTSKGVPSHIWAYNPKELVNGTIEILLESL